MGTVRVRRLKSKDEYELPTEEEVLLVPHELQDYAGACERTEEGYVVCEGDGGQHLSRVRPARLGECHPGERVLVEFEEYVDTPGWWLCEVEAVEGDDYASS